MAKTTTFNEEMNLNASDNCPFEEGGKCVCSKMQSVDTLCKNNVFSCPTQVARFVPGVL